MFGYQVFQRFCNSTSRVKLKRYLQPLTIAHPNSRTKKMKKNAILFNFETGKSSQKLDINCTSVEVKSKTNNNDLNPHMPLSWVRTRAALVGGKRTHPFATHKSFICLAIGEMRSLVPLNWCNCF